MNFYLQHRVPVVLSTGDEEYQCDISKELARDPQKEKFKSYQNDNGGNNPLHLTRHKLMSLNSVSSNEEDRRIAYKMVNLINKHYNLNIDDIDGYFKKNCNELYDHIKNKIQMAQEKSKVTTKPLLILFGEAQNSTFSSVVAVIAMLVAKELGIEDFTIELDNERATYFENEYKEYGDHPLQYAGNYWKSEILMRLLAEYLPTHLQPIDIGGHLKPYPRNQVTLLQPTTKLTPVSAGVGTDHQLTTDYRTMEGMQYRNTIMAHELKEKHKDAVAFVEFYHLYGLVKEECLDNDFELVILNTATDEDAKEKDEYLQKCLTYKAQCKDINQYLLKKNTLIHLDNCEFNVDLPLFELALYRINPHEIVLETLEAIRDKSKPAKEVYDGILKDNKFAFTELRNNTSMVSLSFRLTLNQAALKAKEFINLVNSATLAGALKAKNDEYSEKIAKEITLQTDLIFKSFDEILSWKFDFEDPAKVNKSLSLQYHEGLNLKLAYKKNHEGLIQFISDMGQKYDLNKALNLALKTIIDNIKERLKLITKNKENEAKITSIRYLLYKLPSCPISYSLHNLHSILQLEREAAQLFSEIATEDNNRLLRKLYFRGELLRRYGARILMYSRFCAPCLLALLSLKRVSEKSNDLVLDSTNRFTLFAEGAKLN